VGGLHEAAYLLALFALVSQLLALVRDRLLAHTFGASVTLDVYYAAFRIPDFLFVSVASIVSLFVLIPFLTEKIARDTAAARRFLSSVTSAFFIFIVLASAVMFLVIPWLAPRLFPGFADPKVYGELVLLMRILLLSPILLGLSNILASVTQVFRKFFIYALSPVVYNLGIILGIVLLYPVMGLPGLAYGVVLGALLHMGIQIPAVIRSGLLPSFVFIIDWRAVWQVVKVSLPRTIALSFNQAAVLALVALASLFPEGSIAIFNFALNLQGAPLVVIGVSYSVAAFPTLAQLFSRGDSESFLGQMAVTIRHVLFWSFPVMVLVIVLRAQIVRTVLGSGAFTWFDTRLTAAALALFVVSLAAHALVLLFVRGYYASGRTRRPLAVNAFASGLIILSAYAGSLLFANMPTVQYFIEALFRVSDVPGTEILVLPLAYSFGMLVNALVFWLLFRKDFGGHLPRHLYTTLWQSFSAAIIGGGAAYVGLQLFATVFDLQTLLGIFLQGLCAGLIGIAVFVITLIAVGNREVGEISGAFRAKFWKRTPVAPEPDEL
jgi:putative peptidoglycan lipid II flippase